MNLKEAKEIIVKNMEKENDKTSLTYAYLKGFEQGVRDAAKIADRICGELETHTSETGGMEEAITIRNLILNLLGEVKK